MTRISNEQKLQEVHARLKSEFEEIQSAVRDERLLCLKDRRFCSIAGAQYEGNLKAQYENKPKFEANKIHSAIVRILNEYRNNRITVDFVSKDGSADIKITETCTGLFRADEQASTADEAYDNAFEEMISGGIGAWRLRSAYENDEDDEDDRQRIITEPICDADSTVFFSLDSKRQDKSDAKKCFVLTAMSKQAYIDEWGDDPASWNKEIHQSEFDWSTSDTVYIAEAYEIEEKKETIRIFKNIIGEEERYSQSDFDNDEALENTLAAVGSIEIRRKKIKSRRVHKYIMSGSTILEDCGYIAGRNIPIVIVFGKRWVVDNVERAMGHGRFATDSQRLKNMQITKLAEISAMSSIDKPILFPEQVSGHQVMWSEDNIKDYPYLLINPLTDAAGNTTYATPVAYTRAPQIPPAMAALLQITETDMQEILGNQGGADKMVSNISGKAVEMIQQRIDGQAFIYMSNFAKGMKRNGEIWLSMAKELYVEAKRKMKIIDRSAAAGTIELMKPSVDMQSGEIVHENDLTKASLDVVVDVGPSSSSKKQSTVRALTNMLQMTQDPETSQVLTAMAMMNVEGEGMGETNAFFRKKLLRMGAVKPTEAEAKEMLTEMQGKPQDPNAVYLQSLAENENAKAAKARADTVETIANAELIRARTLETLGNADANSQDMAIKNTKAVQEMLRGEVVQ